jgi:4a-hydroxytetrahydrobiopterin dehydratase
MKPEPLPGERVVERLREVPDWTLGGQSIIRTFRCGDFDGAMRFANDVAGAANAANHHPDIAISWDRVTLTLWSHDAGGLTDRDFDLARTIDAIGG